jgi:soluble lytic murein transglycosylase
VVSQQARANRLDSNLVLGLIRQESAFDPHATSSANARGLMQLLPSTAGGVTKRSRLAAERQLYSPDYNIRVGCHYLADLIRMFHGNVEEAVAAYNAGDTRVREWLKGRSFGEPAEFVESIPFRDTRAYVEAVMRDGKIYQGLFANSTKFRKCNWTSNSKAECTSDPCARPLEVLPFSPSPGESVPGKQQISKS